MYTVFMAVVESSEVAAADHSRLACETLRVVDLEKERWR